MSEKNEYTQEEIMKKMREVHKPYVKNGKEYSQKEMIKDVGTLDCKSCPPLKRNKKKDKKIRKYTDLL